MTDIIQIVRRHLRGSSSKQKAVADACDIPWTTLRKIVNGETNDPRHKTVEKLRAYYLSRRERGE